MKKVLMASVVLSVFALALLLVQLASCKKSNANCPTPTYPVSGIWQGTYQTDQVSHPATYASLMIYPDGTIFKRNQVVGTSEFTVSRGRWTMTGNTLQYRDTTILYSGGTVVETGSLTYSNNGTMSAGTWQNVGGQTYTGSFQNMKRIN